MKKIYCIILLLLFFLSSCGKISKAMKIGKYENYSSFVQQVDRTVNNFDIMYGNIFVVNGELNKNFNEEELKKLAEIETYIAGLNDEIEKVEGISDSEPKFEKADKSFNDYLEAVKEEKGKILQIISYYKNGEYRNDNFKKAQDLYNEYREMKKRNKDRISNFEEAFEELRIKLSDEEIKNMEKDNNLAGAELYKFSMISNDFLDKLNKKYYENTSLENKKIDIEKLTKLRNDFEKVSENFGKIQKSEIEKSRYNYENYSKIQNYSKELQAIEKNIMEKIQSKDDFYDEIVKFGNVMENVNQEYDEVMGEKN